MRLGSICTGTGILDEAVRHVTGAETAWTADNDPGAAALLSYRYPDVSNLGDISVANWEAVRKLMPVDILAGGFPCQDVSCAGPRDGLLRGNRRGVWYYFVKAVQGLRPQTVVIENVRSLLSAKAHSDVERCPGCVGKDRDRPLRALGAVLGDLAGLGYDAEWCTVRASDAGAPHRRERVFIWAQAAAYS